MPASDMKLPVPKIQAEVEKVAKCHSFRLLLEWEFGKWTVENSFCLKAKFTESQNDRFPMKWNIHIFFWWTKIQNNVNYKVGLLFSSQMERCTLPCNWCSSTSRTFHLSQTKSEIWWKQKYRLPHKCTKAFYSVVEFFTYWSLHFISAKLGLFCLTLDTKECVFNT